uniref:Gypsy type transposon, putative n=2 Tax=Oryza sativa subsp. japonica TaxID=39947 RepID=Q2R760_ORYSJ|nr:Putative gypsy type transposon, putative [Oryza sativa Japonica Group]ABA92635.1 retrotransposon protein, putative, Ty3-gypsy subclass [Oryza sativa Japonica Group]
MAPRKPTKAGSTGEDPRSLGEGWSCFLGKSLVKEADFGELVLSSSLTEGQGSCGGEAVVPLPRDGRTVVFAAYFATGLRLPCDNFLPSVLSMYEVRLPQLSPLAFPKLALFAWMCRTCGFAPTAELFAALFTACASTKDVQTPAGPRKTIFSCVNFMLRPERSDAWPVLASMAKWDRNWMQKWFYISNPYSAKDAQANRLLFERFAVSINAKPNVEINGTVESRLILLRKVARRLSTRDLCKEFCLLRISPLARVWDVSVNEGEEVLGLPRLVLPAGAEMRTLEDAEIEALKMIGALTTAEFARLLQRQADGRMNHVYTGELPSRSNPSRAGDDEAGTSKKRKRAVAKGGQVRTRRSARPPSKVMGRRKKRRMRRPVLRRMALMPRKPVMTVKRKKKKGKVVQVGHGFSDSEGSDGTTTSPVLRRATSRGRRMSLPPASDAEAATGRSASAPDAGANVAEDEWVDAVPSPIRQQEWKAPAVEASVSDVTVTTGINPTGVPYVRVLFLVPGGKGEQGNNNNNNNKVITKVIAPTEGLGLFTELNEFGESCAAVESLFVRGLAVHLSAKKSALERLDGYRLYLCKSEEDIRHKEDERRVVAETLKKANAENRAFRKGFWEDGGRDCAKIRLRENLERIARNEEAAAANFEKDPGPSERSTGHKGEGDGGQDHPEACGRKVCVRPPAENWRNSNEKFMALKGLPKIPTFPESPFSQEKNLKSSKASKASHTDPKQPFEHVEPV